VIPRRSALPVSSSLLATCALLVAATATAAPADRVRPPDGWGLDADRAARLAPHLGRDSHFGGAALDGSEVGVWSAPDGGAALIVSIVRAPAPADLAAAVRAELDLVRGTSRAAALDGSTVTETRWDERIADRAVEATLVWRHGGHASTSTSRTLISARGDGIERITGECVSRDDQPAGAACVAALGSLAPGIPAGQRVEIAIGAVGSAPPPAAASPGVPDRAPPRLGDGSQLSLPPMKVEAAPPADRRPFYVIGGLLILGAIFFWNRARAARIGADAGRRWRRDAAAASTDKGEPS
jgi:hypothetical protein